MRRLLYCLLGSALFHAALLWVPLPMNAGGAGADDLLLVRVRFVEAPRSDAVQRKSRRDERAERNGRALQARTKPRHVAPETPRVARRAEPVRPTLEASADVATRHAVSDNPTKIPSITAAARKQRDTGGDGTENPLKTATAGSKREVGGARNIARGTPAEQVTAGAEFSPVRYARTVKPRYPRKARRAGWEGTTLLKVLVNSEGAPGRVTVERTSGFEILDEAAVKAVRRWRFHPARRGIAPLSSWVRIPVAFRLEEVRR